MSLKSPKLISLKIQNIATDLDCSFCVHGDDVVGVPGQLIEGHGRPLMDRFVFGLEVAHERGHGTRITKGRPVAATHGAEADGLGQVAAEPLVGLRAERTTTGCC